MKNNVINAHLLLIYPKVKLGNIKKDQKFFMIRILRKQFKE